MNNSLNHFTLFINQQKCKEAYFKENFIFYFKEKQQKKQQRKILLQQPIKFQIKKTQIIQNKQYKFHINLKIKSEHALSLNLVVNGKESLQYVFKHLSGFGVAMGLQEMIISFQKIGEGSFASVYKIVTNYDSIIALKMFEKKNLQIPKNQLAFKNQINIMRALQSPYLASANAIFETDKAFYIQMQYFSTTLKSYIKENISLKKQKIIMKQLLQAVLVMKSTKIIHRDLKPENIMIRTVKNNIKSQEDFQCVIIDFGLATQVDANYIFYRCGTPGFLAPQVAKMTRKQKLTTQCDVFSLGCIFFKMITKKYIFSDPQYTKVVEKNKKVQLPEYMFLKLSENENDLIRKMLQKDPNKRISPEDALNHPYFQKDIDQQDVIPSQNCDIYKKITKFNENILKKQSMQSMMSQFSSFGSIQSKNTSNFGSNQSNLHNISQIKDSCISFQGPIRQKKQNSILKQIDRNAKRKSRFSQINQNQKICIF